MRSRQKYLLELPPPLYMREDGTDLLAFFPCFILFFASKFREEKIYTTTVETLPFFSGPEAFLLCFFPSFRTYGVYPFPLFSQANGIHHGLFCSMTSGSGDRPRKEGCHGGGVYSFFPRKFGLPHKQKIGVNKGWVRESEIGEECREFGRGSWACGPETLEKQGRELRYRNSLRNSLAIFQIFARPTLKIHPTSALQNLGVKTSWTLKKSL